MEFVNNTDNLVNDIKAIKKRKSKKDIVDQENQDKHKTKDNLDNKKEININSNIYEVNGFLNNFGFCVEKNKLSLRILFFLRIYFKVTPKSNYEEEKKDIEEKSFEVFYEDDNYLILPKFVSTLQLNLKDAIQEFNTSNSYNKIIFIISKYGYKKKSTNFNFNGNLREPQKLIINTVLEKFGLDLSNPTNHSESKKSKGGLIKLSCGGGKTVLAIYLSHILGLKTLIIVHKEFLLDQWVERFKQFTNAKVGIIRQNKVDVENKDVVIGMLQSISMKDYDDSIFNEFGLVVYDEVHHVASKVFSQALLKTSAEYTVGLSATPERSDGLLKVIKWHIGDVLYTMEKKIDYRVLVKKIYFRSDDKTWIEKKRWFQGRMAPDNNKMIDIMAELKSRNDMIIKLIDTLKNLGRKMLILSYRVEHLELIKSAVDEKIKADGETHIYNSYFYMGKTKKGERRMAEKDGDIIFATMQLAEEGLDIPHLDTILFALPVPIKKEKETKIKYDKTLIQSVGRILRNDKLEVLTQIPLVVDIVDILSIYQTWAKKRDEVYGKKNWYQQLYYWTDNNYIYGFDEDKKKEPMEIMFGDIQDEEFIESNLILKTDCKLDSIDSIDSIDSLDSLEKDLEDESS
jgi:superfamily II DNA or RNA helicase